jgi:hypothetical protein
VSRIESELLIAFALTSYRQLRDDSAVREVVITVPKRVYLGLDDGQRSVPATEDSIRDARRTRSTGRSSPCIEDREQLFVTRCLKSVEF